MFSDRTRLLRTFRCFGLVAAGLLSLSILVPMVAAAQVIPVSAKWVTALGATKHSPQLVLFRKVIAFDALWVSYPVHVSADISAYDTYSVSTSL
jgi:hypothetical protein